MKVKAKINTKRLIEDEWYELIDESLHHIHKTPLYYKIENHTNKIWCNVCSNGLSDTCLSLPIPHKPTNTDWFDAISFNTKEEVRELKLNQILDTNES